MFRVWFCDLEKALAAFRKVVTDDLFCKIEGNCYGDFVITLNEKETYIVKHDDFSVWHNIYDDPVCADGSVDAYESCEECPYFYDCYEEVEE